MPSSFRDPKTLPEWIELDYFRRPRRFWRLRRGVIWLVLLTCLGLLAVTAWPKTRFIYESRPVSSAHTMFNNNCGICHIESFQTAKRLVGGDREVRSVGNDTCRQCHDGPPHHEHLVPNPDCATCHQEHRGQLILARVADSHCTQCHADLERQVGGECSFFPKISGFTKDHPRFGAWRGKALDDPGTIRFNHEAHLQLKGKPLRGIDQPLLDLQRNDCGYCHQPDPAGRYMKPVNYEQHCSQCHPLSIQLVGKWHDARVQAAAETFRKLPAPHKDPGTVRAALRERYIQFVEENPSVIGTKEMTEALPRLPWLQPPQSGTETKDSWAKQQLQEGERILFTGGGGCRYCHEVRVERGARGLPEYAPSSIRAASIPERWFPHSFFSHDRHQMLKCTECHDATHSRLTSDMLMPTIENCRECHSPQRGTRTDCAECHHYHDRTKETFKGKLSIPDCLRSE